MGINWKTKESTDRLIGSILAAHPSLKFNYEKMAKLFGNGATYDSVEFRFRGYRKEAEKLKREAIENGVDIDDNSGAGGRSGGGTPRTPRAGRSGITKPSSKKGDSKTAKSVKDNFDATPTKGKMTFANNEVISLDDDDDDDVCVKDELKREQFEELFGTNAVKPKMENTGNIGLLYDIEREPVPKQVNSQTNGYVDQNQTRATTKTTQKETETTKGNHSEDDEDYEYDDVA